MLKSQNFSFFLKVFTLFLILMAAPQNQREADEQQNVGELLQPVELEALPSYRNDEVKSA